MYIIMIKDRGNIKWTSLMLTEHRKKLKEIWDHDQDVKRPILDEQQLEVLENKIKEAIQSK